MRIEPGVVRGAPIVIRVDGVAMSCFKGETIATAMLAAGRTIFRRDAEGRARGLFCNMGTCCECMVTLPGGRRLRACITDVHDGLEVSTDG